MNRAFPFSKGPSSKGRSSKRPSGKRPFPNGHVPAGPASLHRRQLLVDGGMGLTGLALATMLQQEQVVGAGPQDGQVEPAVRRSASAKAKSVIWIFLNGGLSHLESFDPKPAVNKYAGMTIEESPHASDVLESEFYRSNVRDFGGKPRELMARLYPLQVGYQQRGESGIAISDWWPHL